jgi:xanthine dehydrogenase YagS FAD-binding subunit
MKNFVHIQAHSLDEAALLLRRYGGKAVVISGGTDLLGKMKDEILPGYPEALINIKTIPGLDFIKEQNGMLRVGALTRLGDISRNTMIGERYTAIAEAAKRAASPQIREMGTLGGNICQDIRCWYYRNPLNRFPCLRKGGGRCYAIEGDNRYHSIFGGSVEGGCYAVHPSDMAPALIALDAQVKTTKRTVKIEDFFKVGVQTTTILDHDEIVAEIRIPPPIARTRSCFLKFALRASIDFPIVNCAVMLATEGEEVLKARICLNAVHVNPYRSRKAEAILIDHRISEKTAEAAATAAISEAKPLSENQYMVPIAKALIRRAILTCRQGN